MRIKRRIWFMLHGWFSLPVWLIFCFIVVTGTIAVISHELTWLTNPDARAHNPDNLPAKPLPELVASVKQQVPNASIHQVIVLEPYLTRAVGLTSPEYPIQAYAYVNQYTGEVQAINTGITFIGFMRSLHGWLLFPWQHSYSIGYYLVGAMSIVILGALITGLVVYRRFWRAFTQPRIRTDRGSRALLGDLHRFAGVWSLWFLLIIGLTGLWYLIQAMLWHNEVDIWPHETPIAHQQVPLSEDGSPTPLSLAQALETAQQTMPHLNPSWISYPEHNRDTYKISGDGNSIFFDGFSHRVFINPWDGQVTETRSPAMMNGLQTITHLADPLHYGTFGGLWTKIIWFVFGLILSAMSITGFMIWRKRTKSAASKKTKTVTTAVAGNIPRLEGES